MVKVAPAPQKSGNVGQVKKQPGPQVKKPTVASNAPAKSINVGQVKKQPGPEVKKATGVTSNAPAKSVNVGQGQKQPGSEIKKAPGATSNAPAKSVNVGQDQKQPAPEVRKSGGISSIPVKSSESSLAKQRWITILSKVMSVNAETRARNRQQSDAARHEGLIEELKKSQQRSKVKESVLSILKTQSNLNLPEKVFERQKYSAKEILIRKRAASSKGLSMLDRRSHTLVQLETIAEYNRQARLRYKVTPEIQEKLDKIKAENDAAAEKKKKKEEENVKPGFFSRLLGSSIIGQTLMANPRFYKMNPHEHLPDLCRRCRRPLVDTLESRFTAVGILFLFFMPIIGILLLYANREFVCVICEEVYVYGDLTARPEEEFYEEDEK